MGQSKRAFVTACKMALMVVAAVAGGALVELATSAAHAESNAAERQAAALERIADSQRDQTRSLQSLVQAVDRAGRCK
jgi:hypothetical protein